MQRCRVSGVGGGGRLRITDPLHLFSPQIVQRLRVGQSTRHVTFSPIGPEEGLNLGGMYVASRPLDESLVVDYILGFELGT